MATVVQLLVPGLVAIGTSADSGVGSSAPTTCPYSVSWSSDRPTVRARIEMVRPVIEPKSPGMSVSEHAALPGRLLGVLEVRRRVRAGDGVVDRVVGEGRAADLDRGVATPVGGRQDGRERSAASTTTAGGGRGVRDGSAAERCCVVPGKVLRIGGVAGTTYEAVTTSELITALVMDTLTVDPPIATAATPLGLPFAVTTMSPGAGVELGSSGSS